MAEWTDADTDQFHLFLGRYVASFQWIEGKLDEIVLLARGHDRWAETQTKLARLNVAGKIKEFEKLAADPAIFPRMGGLPDWGERVGNTAERLRIENDRRNHLLHSLMMPRFLNAGLAPHMSRRRKGSDGEPVDFDVVIYDHAKMKDVTEEIGQLALLLGMIHAQLIHLS